MTGAEPVKRTAEIEEWTNRVVIHPVSSRLTPWLARLGVSPNAVSLAGMACGLAAGMAYHRSVAGPAYAVAGLLLMLAWHVLDGADGQLARLTHTQGAGRHLRLRDLRRGLCRAGRRTRSASWRLGLAPGGRLGCVPRGAVRGL